MATFNSPSNVLNNCVKSTEALQSTATFFVPSPSPLLGVNSSNFAAAAAAATASAIENHSYIGLQKNLPHLTHHVNSSSSYTFMEIKREPCQVSEVTTSNSLQTNHRQTNKSLSSSMTTMVKIESASPKISEMEKVVSQMNPNNQVPVGIAVARKRPPETTLHTTTLQQPRDINYFGIRVADIGSDLITGASAEDINATMHNVNRSASTFWQYPNAFPIESVISMSPVGLPYSRDSSRGQLILLPATAAMDSFQPAAFLWPPYMQQNSTAPLQPPSNFIFPSIGPQTNAQPQPFGTPLQLLGPNYFTAATAAATSTLCQHSQTTGNRYASISSDVKRIDISQKHGAIKVEEWNSEPNLLNKPTNMISHHMTVPNRLDRSKVANETNYLAMQTNTNLSEPMPVLPHEQQHILLHNTPSPPEFINMPILSSNYITTATEAPPVQPLTMSQGLDASLYKNPIHRNSFSKTPEMQDVTIQTDTPVCSEDESSCLEVSSAEAVSCTIQSTEKNKSTTTAFPLSQCHNNFNGCKALLKENSTEPYQIPVINTDHIKENNIYTVSETTRQFEDGFVSPRTPNKNEYYNPESPHCTISNGDRNDSASYKVTSTPIMEMSGLELLSNISTGSYINHAPVCVKQEPCDNSEIDQSNTIACNYEPTCRTITPQQYCPPIDESEMQNTIPSSTQNPEPPPPLGGLNLLCALAEQRIQEEVESNTFTNNSPKEEKAEVKHKKHKHSKMKTNKKSRYYKKSKKKYAKERKEYIKTSCLKLKCNDMHENLKSALKKVDPNFKNKWRDPEDFFKAMESDMRMRLADITRQYKKKKRKLDEISKKRKKVTSSEYKFANISCKNPNFICFLDKFQSTSSNFPPLEGTEGQHITINSKTNVECISEDMPSHGEIAYPSIFNARPSSSHSTIMPEKLHCDESHMDNINKKQTSTSTVTATATAPSTLSATSTSTIISTADKKIPSSRLLTPESPNQSPVSTMKIENKGHSEIDSKLLLSNEHLFRKETRVLTDMGGLFYAGTLKPLQPPDVYAITLDGERGNKSHIMSREEIFKDTILEVAPQMLEDVPIGARLCAYWSQQYRCLYPGRAIETEVVGGSEFVSVEFDDGDSGRIRLQNIRFLLSDYPIVEYNENPFSTLGKHKKSSVKYLSPGTVINKTSRSDSRAAYVPKTTHEPCTHKSEKKKAQYDKNIPSTTSEYIHKHRKHKKRKKHKKHHRKSLPKLTVALEHTEDSDERIIEEDEKVEDEFSNRETIESKENICILRITETDKVSASDEILKSESIAFDDDDSTSNVVSETSDEAKSIEKVDYRNAKGSKIAAFLPERQLWGWLGQAYRKAGLKGRARKQFYKSITRGKETITVGECAVFLSTGRPDRPYIGRIESMWETTACNKVVRVRWFYHPEETVGCPILKYPGALFDSPHEDENDVQTISHRCEVIEFSVYIEKFGTDVKQYQSIYDNNDTYYLSGYYNPRLQILKLQPDIPVQDNTSA